MAGVMVYCAWVTWYARKRLQTGLPSTFATRSKTLEDGFFYTAAFTAYFAIQSLLYLILWQNNIQALYIIMAFVLGMLGVVDFAMWFWKNFQCCGSESSSHQQIFSLVSEETSPEKGGDASTTINLALRREVLDFTTNGIAKSVRHANRQLNARNQRGDSERLPPMVDYPNRLQFEAGGATSAVNQFPLFLDEDLSFVESVSEPNFDVLETKEFGTPTLAPKDSWDVPVSRMPKSRGQGAVGVETSSSNLRTSLLSRVGNRRKMSSYGDDCHDRVFTDYAPFVFKFVRSRILSLDDASYIESIQPRTAEQRDKVNAKYTEGRSGAFFYFTHDSRFIVKTVTHDEAKFFLKILQNYVKHIHAHPDSLINKFVGFHSLKMYDLTLYFVVMENIFLSDLKPQETYDLKGSWVDRGTRHGVESGKLMKDMDLRKQILLTGEFRKRLLSQLRKDSEFLASQNIMDYSLLLGIYHVKIATPGGGSGNGDDEEKEVASSLRNYNGGVRASVVAGPGIYYMGIIDTLQEWNYTKRVERWFKTWIKGKEGDGISCVEPHAYQTRFMEFMTSITTTDMKFYESEGVPTDFMDSPMQPVHIFPPESMINSTLSLVRHGSVAGRTVATSDEM